MDFQAFHQLLIALFIVIGVIAAFTGALIVATLALFFMLLMAVSYVFLYPKDVRV